MKIVQTYFTAFDLNNPLQNTDATLIIYLLCWELPLGIRNRSYLVPTKSQDREVVTTVAMRGGSFR